MSDTLVLIPARMGSTRLPGKPLADVGGRPMIVEVARRAAAAHVGPVVVATDAPEVVEVVKAAGFDVVLTWSGHASGSDRIFEALEKWPGSDAVRHVVNVQGDLPTIDPSHIRRSLELLAEPNVDIATLAARIEEPSERTNPNVVKVVGSPLSATRLRALYFTRATAPWGEGPLYHHIGLYAYRREALARFIAAPASTLETRERLEQLRALEMGMRIDVEIVEGAPLGVDAPEDLERAREILAQEKAGTEASA